MVEWLIPMNKHAEFLVEYKKRLSGNYHSMCNYHSMAHNEYRKSNGKQWIQKKTQSQHAPKTQSHNYLYYLK